VRSDCSLTLTKRTVDALKPQDKPWIAWDDKLTGFGVRAHPSGAKSYVVNYRAGNGGRKAPNKCVVVGRSGRVTPDHARRLAQELLGLEPAQRVANHIDKLMGTPRRLDEQSCDSAPANTEP